MGTSVQMWMTKQNGTDHYLKMVDILQMDEKSPTMNFMINQWMVVVVMHRVLVQMDIIVD